MYAVPQSFIWECIYTCFGCKTYCTSYDLNIAPANTAISITVWLIQQPLITTHMQYYPRASDALLLFFKRVITAGAGNLFLSILGENAIYWHIDFIYFNNLYLKLWRSRSSVSKSNRGCWTSEGPWDWRTEDEEEMTVVWPEGWMVLNWNCGPIQRRRWGPVWVTISTWDLREKISEARIWLSNAHNVQMLTHQLS